MMRLIAFIAYAAFVVSISTFFIVDAATLDANYEFYRFTIQYNKNYTTPFEFARRRSVFEKNYNLIVESNKNEHSYKLGINEYTDLFSSEYHPNRRYAESSVDRNVIESNDWIARTPKVDLDRKVLKVDWRTSGAVTSVKNQQSCGSCWAFSTTGSIEGAWSIKTKKLVSLSEQQLMDCSKSEGDESCEGGLMDNAFQYIIKNGGLCSEASYPYLALDQDSCMRCKDIATISSYVDVAANNVTALLDAVTLGPVSVAIEADTTSFQLYSSGVYSNTGCGTALDHGVLVVGFNLVSNPPYWIVKNSWGSSWGENGYIRLAINAANPEGQCGILMKASYPVV